MHKLIKQGKEKETEGNTTKPRSYIKSFVRSLLSTKNGEQQRFEMSCSIYDGYAMLLRKSALVLTLLLMIWLTSPVMGSPRPMGGGRRGASQSRRVARAFTVDELVARYELMVQYKHGNVSDCPVVWRYSGQPSTFEGSVMLAHNDIEIAAHNDSLPVSCDGTGTLRLLSSTMLADSRLDAFEAAIANNVDKTTVFDSIHAQLHNRLFMVSAAASTLPPTCGGTMWFDNGEMFVFFDEIETLMLSVVSKIQNGGPRILTIPLIGNIRYMVSVAEGTTCIYRVASDVRQVLIDNVEPSGSPSASPQVSFLLLTPLLLFFYLSETMCFHR